MLKAQAVIEELLEAKVLEFVLVLHLDLDYLALFDIFEADVVLGQVNVGDALVVLQVLRQDEQVFAVQALVDQRQVLELVSLDGMQRHLASIDR